MGRLRESPSQKHNEDNHGQCRDDSSMQLKQMFSFGELCGQKLELTIAREQDEEDARARMAEQLELMEGQAREAMAASMAASMAVAEGGMSASEVASMRAKTRWQKLRVMDSKASGYLEASAVRGLQAMLSGENVDGAIEAANLVTPRTGRKRRRKRMVLLGTAVAHAQSWICGLYGLEPPGGRGSGSYASTGFDSRRGCGAGSRPNSRSNRAAGSRGAGRMTWHRKRKSGWRHAT